MPRILYFFALCNLVIGSGAFLLGGILQNISVSLGVSVAVAGQATTAYAISTAVLAPLLVVMTAKWPAKRSIQLALAIFTTGSVVCALAPDFRVLLLGRVLMGAGAMFTAAASALAVNLVEPARRGRALSITFLGMSISYAVGVPLGAWLGIEYGWRVPVSLAAAASFIALLAASRLLPVTLTSSKPSFTGFAAAARQGPVLRVWLRTLLYFVAIFSVFAYVGPVLLALNPMGSTGLSLTLAVFGMAGVGGTLMGGWANDRFGAIRTLRVLLAVLIATMCLLPLTAGYLPATLITLVVWGLAGFGMMAPQQTRLTQASPAQAPLLLSLNASMLYVGSALGAVISGALISSLGFAQLGWAGVPFGVAAWLTLLFEGKGTSPASGVATAARPV